MKSYDKNLAFDVCLQGRQAMEMVISKINREVQDLASNIEQATSRPFAIVAEVTVNQM